MPEHKHSPFSWSKGKIILLIALLFLGTYCLITFTRAPRYDGKTVSEWLAYIDLNQPEVTARTHAELMKIGSNALPDLEAILSEKKYNANHLKRSIIDTAIRLHLLRKQSINLESLQGRACYAACFLAASNHVDISVLVPSLEFHQTNNTYASYLGAQALAYCGDQGARTLTNLMFSPQRSVRYNALQGLRLARSNSVAITGLLKAAEIDEDIILRANALELLKNSGTPPDQLIAVAIPMLNQTNLYAQAIAATLLSKYPDNTTAAQALATYQARKNALSNSTPASLPFRTTNK
jgi:hypothetical protein